MNKSANIWDEIVNEGLIIGTNQPKPRTSTLILVGTHRAGKSTIIHLFLDREDEPKPSLPVEFIYARRTNKQMFKDVCNIWEIDIRNIHFVNQLVENEQLKSVSVLINFDLTNTQELLPACEIVSKFYQTNCQSNKMNVNYGIIGSKYDLLEELEAEKKSAICGIIQYYATTIQAPFIMCSKKDRITTKLAKDLFSHLAFNTKLSSNQMKFDHITIPKKHNSGQSEADYLKERFSCIFGSQSKMGKKTAITSEPDERDDPYFYNQIIDTRRLEKF